ncbi:MAG TPA: cytidylate kinase [Thermoplasmatales archaeon]|nr:cytidylate kinase [Thermoplasmatales archaeon]
MVTITISGAPGSGTTTVAKILRDQLKIKYVYAGEIFRKEAERYGMSLQDFGKYCEEHPEIDKKLDELQKKILKKGNVILEGRIAGWIAHRNNIPALKVLIEADEKTRVERIIKRESGDFEEKRREMLEREQSEAKRYKNYYGIDVGDKSIYDLVIDSTNKTPEEVASIIISNVRK